MFKSKKAVALLLSTAAVLSVVALSGCQKSSSTSASGSNATARPTASEVKKEGQLVSYGMPDTWINWKGIFSSFTSQYGITHQDTDMSSAEELAKFKAEKNNPVADIGDIGIGFAAGARKSKIVQAYKNKYWNDVPSWAKDKDGYWTAEYTGSIVFLVNKSLVKDVPQSWADLLKSEYKGMVVVGDMQKHAQSQSALLAAAMAHGGSESNIKPGLDYFKKMYKAGNIKDVDDSVSNIQKGEVPICVLWDFNALNYRHEIGGDSTYDVVVPSDGTVTSAYVSVINAYAPHPQAAKAFQDYLFSDAGQAQIAEGYARPIRSNVNMPADVKSKLLPDSAYKSAKLIKNYDTWTKTSEEIPDQWRNEVLS